ncbi:hypothetical protein AB0K11_09305 [Mycobacterium sp. NPDC050551]|uniref:hypothetical protein n=1 Tax=Mycobacterium sp. NPDC050551 TaxID=3155407 RepID=UPI00344178C0
MREARAVRAESTAGAATIATAAAISGVLAAAFGVAATLRALLIFQMSQAVDASTMQRAYAFVSAGVPAGVTATLFAGVVLLHGKQPAGRLLLVAGGTVVLLITAADLVMWFGSDRVAWSNDSVIGAHRWGWTAIAITTMVLASLPGTRRWCSGRPPVSARRRDAAAIAAAAVSLPMAAYLCWLAWRQYDLGWGFVEMGGVFGSDIGSVWSRVMLETFLAAVVTAAVLVAAWVALLFGAAVGRWLLVAAAAFTLGQTVYGSTDFALLLTELGAPDLLRIFAPRTAAAVLFAVVAPLVIVVLAVLPSPKSAR